MRINLCGLGPGWSLCPPSGEGQDAVWGINNILIRRPVDMVFEVHDWHEKLNRLKGGHIHQRAIRTAIADKVTYMVREYWDFLPHLNQVVYPWEEIFEYFQSDYLGCSFDCMIALAVYSGYDDIQVYGAGANMASSYDYQLPTNSFWIGYCMGAKVNINFHNVGGLRHTDLLRTENGLVYGLGIPQRAWPTIDPSLPACECTKIPQSKCSDY